VLWCPVLHDLQGLDLQVSPYKHAGTSIIGGTDNVQALLDDQIVTLQAINVLPLVKQFQELSVKHEAMLQTLQDMLDACLQRRQAPGSAA
jgi:dynein heavy chain, axonemal